MTSGDADAISPSYPLPDSPLGIWSYVPWCDMVARGRFDSRVLVKRDHLSLGGCNAYRVDCEVEPPAIHCNRVSHGLVACRSPEQLASDARAARHAELALSASKLQIVGRKLVFYAADGAVLFSLHQYIDTEGCENAQKKL